MSDVLTPQFCYSLLKAHEEVRHYAADTLAHFNFFLEKRLPRMVREHCACNVTVPATAEGFAEPRRHAVTFGNVCLERPTVPKTDGAARGIRVMQVGGEPLFPHEALLRGLTYTAGVFVDITHEIWVGESGAERLEETLVYRNVYFFSMPIPVRCIACNLTDEELARHPTARPDPEDHGGYWIVRGMCKVIQPQKVQRNNILLIRAVTKGTESWLEANIRSIRADDKFRSTSTLKAYLVPSGLLTIDIPYLKDNQSVVAAFRLLGVHTRDEIEAFVFDAGNTVGAWNPEHVDAARRLFASSFAAPVATCDESELVSIMGAPLEVTPAADVSVSVVATEARLRRMVAQQVAGELLPHCGFDDSAATRHKKAVFLGMMCRRMLFIHLGFEDADDRDFEGFKSLQMCSTTLSMFMRQLMGQFSRTLRKRIFDRVKDGKHVDVASIVLHMDTMPQLISAFTDGEVTVQKEASNAGKEVIQLVQQVNPLSLQVRDDGVSHRVRPRSTQSPRSSGRCR